MPFPLWPIFAAVAAIRAYRAPSKTVTQSKPVRSDRPSVWVANLANVAAPITAQCGAPLPLALAQAAIETGWGRSVPAHNLFGLKGKGPAGSVVVATREEFTPGTSTRILDKFRGFNNDGEAVASWCRYITAPQNRPPVANPSAASWLVWYWAKGYATASRYPQTAASISRSIASRLGRPELAIVFSADVRALADELSKLTPRQRRKRAQALAAEGRWPS